MIRNIQNMSLSITRATCCHSSCSSTSDSSLRVLSTSILRYITRSSRAPFLSYMCTCTSDEFVQVTRNSTFRLSSALISFVWWFWRDIIPVPFCCEITPAASFSLDSRFSASSASVLAAEITIGWLWFDLSSEKRVQQTTLERYFKTRILIQLGTLTWCGGQWWSLRTKTVAITDTEARDIDTDKYISEMTNDISTCKKRHYVQWCLKYFILSQENFYCTYNISTRSTLMNFAQSIELSFDLWSRVKEGRKCFI